MNPLRLPRPWEKTAIYISVDPGQIRSAFAYSYAVSSSLVRGLFRVDDISDAQKVREAFASLVLTAVSEKRRVVLVVEYPYGTYGNSAAVRAAANVWIRVFKKLFPRRLEVRKVTPTTWQGAFGYRSRAKDKTTKDHSLEEAKFRGWLPETADEADAAMILEYGTMTPPKERKKPVRKAP